MHKPIWTLKGNKPILLSVHGGATSYILSGTILKSLFVRILMFDMVMQKSDLKTCMIWQGLKWLASLTAHKQVNSYVGRASSHRLEDDTIEQVDLGLKKNKRIKRPWMAHFSLINSFSIMYRWESGQTPWQNFLQIKFAWVKVQNLINPELKKFKS